MTTELPLHQKNVLTICTELEKIPVLGSLAESHANFATLGALTPLKQKSNKTIQSHPALKRGNEVGIGHH